MADRQRSPRSPLRANAVFSALSGAMLVFMPAWWAERIGIGAPSLLAALGAGLLAFAGLALWASARPADRRRTVTGIITADVLWVLGTPMAMLGGGAVLTPLGQGVLAGVAIVVAALAALQWRGLRGLGA